MARSMNCVGEAVTDPGERLRGVDIEALQLGVVGAAHPVRHGAAPVAGVQKPAQLLPLPRLEHGVDLVHEERGGLLIDDTEKRGVADVRRR
jgi:hypothetical protein